jgi:hypothetical protein
MAPPSALPQAADACLAALQAAGSGLMERGLLLLPAGVPPLALALAALLLIVVAYLVVDAVRYAAIPTIQVPLTEGEFLIAFGGRARDEERGCSGVAPTAARSRTSRQPPSSPHSHTRAHCTRARLL